MFLQNSKEVHEALCLCFSCCITYPSSSVQFSSVAQSCPTLCNPVDCSTLGFPVHPQLLELIQTHVHWVSGAIQPSHPLLSPSPPTLLPSIRIFSSESFLPIRWPKYWSFSFSISPSSENSGLISFMIDCVVSIVLIVLHVQVSPSLLYKQSGNFSGVCFWRFVYSPYMHSHIIILSFVEMFLDPLWYGFHHLISYCVLSCIHLFLAPWL